MSGALPIILICALLAWPRASNGQMDGVPPPPTSEPPPPVMAQTNSVLPMPNDPLDPSSYSTNFVGATAYERPAFPYTETNTVLVASAEWELTFEWSEDVAFTNAVAYPVSIRVPFEHDSGFVRVVARKVEAEE